MSNWFVYMLRCNDGTLYTGITTDLSKRIATHNAGKGAKYTRARLPVILLWSAAMENEGKARREEIRMKKLKRSEKELMI